MIRKQGITLTVMAITIIILTILAGTITVSTYSTINYSRLSAWATEITYIQDVVDEELNASSGTDFTLGDITINVEATIKDEQFEGETIAEDNTVTLKILDLGKLKITNTKYGNLNIDTDVYAVSSQTGRVYYVQGIEIDGKIYHSLTDTLKQRFNLNIVANNLSSIVFVPSVIGYTNQPITVVVKVPNTYTNIVISTSNDEIQIGSQTTKETTYEYGINGNKIAGNYTVTVSYNNGTQTLTSKYEVNGYDVTAPVINPVVYDNLVYKENDAQTIDYLTNVSATDESGIRKIKYALGTITEEDALTYFKDNGNVIIDGIINLSRETTIYTIYSEDNAGNYSVTTFDKKYLMPDDWKENVSYIQDRVPIPKGFVASPYKDEDNKNEGLVIYELNENETAIPSDETQFESWTKRNQYVWVPVDKNNFVTEFVKNAYKGGTINNYSNLGTPDKYWELEVDETNTPKSKEELSDYIADKDLDYITETTIAESQAMYASVKEYGGFYIGRYEAGIDNHRTGLDSDITNIPRTTSNVHSKMGKIPYTWIPWTINSLRNNAMNEDLNGVVDASRSLYPNNENNTTGVISTLTYDVQWDVTLAWWLDTNAVDSVANSKNYGNHSDHIISSQSDLNDNALVWDYSTDNNGSYVLKNSNTLTYPKGDGTKWFLSTGALKAAKVNNIYDMAGNMLERTMGGVSNNNRARRGGRATIGGFEPVSGYFSGGPNYADKDLSFRPSLYIKLPT